MVLQSDYLAAAVRVRHVVRAWGRQNTCAVRPLSRGAGAGRWLSRFCVLDRDDVACTELGAFRATLARPRHVSHRQDQPRPAAPDPLSRHGGSGRPLHSPHLAGAHRSLVATTRPLRPAFASSLRLRYLLVIAAHIILVEISNRVIVQILVSLAGIALLVAAAWVMTR